MRDILFRGKLIDNGEWVEGFYTVIQNPFTENGKPFRHLICNGTNIFNYDVIPETVGQYTGLTDKNGKKIFEGDIVKHYNHNPIKEYSEDTGRVFWYNTTQRYLRTSSLFPDDCPGLSEMSEYKVIGNIHDNPELMKGDENK